MGPHQRQQLPRRPPFSAHARGQAKARPRPALPNVDKVLTAPVTAIIGADFHSPDKLPRLFPHAPNFKDMFEHSPELTDHTARRNSSLQGAYLILAARALGLDCGPMSGFDNAKVDAEFFGADKECKDCDQEFFPLTHVRSNFLCNLGYGDHARLLPRSPRLSFEEACALL